MAKEGICVVKMGCPCSSYIKIFIYLKIIILDNDINNCLSKKYCNNRLIMCFST